MRSCEPHRAAEMASAKQQQAVDLRVGHAQARQARPRQAHEPGACPVEAWFLLKEAVLEQHCVPVTSAKGSCRTPVTRAPDNRTAGTRPGTGARAPKSKASTTAARTDLPWPHPPPPAGSSSAASPTRTSRLSPSGNASQRECSAPDRSSTRIRHLPENDYGLHMTMIAAQDRLAAARRGPEEGIPGPAGACAVLSGSRLRCRVAESGIAHCRPRKFSFKGFPVGGAASQELRPGRASHR